MCLFYQSGWEAGNSCCMMRLIASGLAGPEDVVQLEPQPDREAVIENPAGECGG